MPDTTDWEWWQWTLAVLAVIILGPIVLAIGVSVLHIIILLKTMTENDKPSKISDLKPLNKQKHKKPPKNVSKSKF